MVRIVSYEIHIQTTYPHRRLYAKDKVKRLSTELYSLPWTNLILSQFSRQRSEIVATTVGTCTFICRNLF